MVISGSYHVSEIGFSNLSVNLICFDRTKSLRPLASKKYTWEGKASMLSVYWLEHVVRNSPLRRATNNQAQGYYGTSHLNGSRLPPCIGS